MRCGVPLTLAAHVSTLTLSDAGRVVPDGAWPGEPCRRELPLGRWATSISGPRRDGSLLRCVNALSSGSTAPGGCPRLRCRTVVVSPVADRQEGDLSLTWTFHALH